MRPSNLAESWKPLSDHNDCTEVFRTVTELCSSWLSLSSHRHVAVDISTGKKSIVSAIGRAASSCGADLLYFPNSEIARSTDLTDALSKLEHEVVARSFFGEIEVNSGTESVARDMWDMNIQMQIGTRLFHQAQWNSCSYHFKRAEACQKAVVEKHERDFEASAPPEEANDHAAEVIPLVTSLSRMFDMSLFRCYQLSLKKATIK